jgi:deoxyribodipyrimidine photo-lyase
MNIVIVLFNRDLRVRDHPALGEAAATATHVVPAFVVDDRLLASGFARPNRLRFLLDSLSDLDGSLARRGARLVVRRGDVVAEVLRLARRTRASAIFASADVSAYARARERLLRAACVEAGIGFRTFPGVTVVPAGTLRPSSGGDHFRVFTPYWNSWRKVPPRSPARAPSRLSLPPELVLGRLPALEELTPDLTSPEVPPGGETAGRARLAAWIRGGLRRYAERRDGLAADTTSRLGPYLHFGCVSPGEIVARLRGRPGAETFLRQLCWRDFHHQVTAAFPAIARQDYRPRGDRWRDDPRAFEAWKAGRTGYPVVDAAMRQLAREGFMPNRARLIAASFLVKDLGIDWRLGAAHFLDLLVDGDVASNSGNWQWVAGTGNDTRPNRVFNPTAQARRFDPDGAYVRRYVPELAGIAGESIHEPWTLDPGARRAIEYPEPIVDHARAAAAFRAGRSDRRPRVSATPSSSPRRTLRRA